MVRIEAEISARVCGYSVSVVGIEAEISARVRGYSVSVV
jgi:hypothetical protein